jgi:integrase
MLPRLGALEPGRITTADVQDWIAGLSIKPSSMKRYLATLRGLLDYAAVDPNPARDARVRLPREERTVVEPPSAAAVEAIILHAPRYRLLLTALAETGMRVGEACDREWRDVDEASGRFRIRKGKTVAARRWLAVPDDLMADIVRSTPPDDRRPDACVFRGATVGAVGSAVDRACKNAKIAHYHPHDLRHRYASVQIARGVPVTMLAAQLGHSRMSLTLDTYSHVLLASSVEPVDGQRAHRRHDRARRVDRRRPLAGQNPTGQGKAPLPLRDRVARASARDKPRRRGHPTFRRVAPAWETAHKVRTATS